MFNIGDTVIIEWERIGRSDFIIDKIDSIDNDIITFVNTDMAINLSCSNGYKIMPYEEGLPHLKKHKIIVNVNNILNNLEINDNNFDSFTEEELEKLYAKVLDLQAVIEEINNKKYKQPIGE